MEISNSSVAPAASFFVFSKPINARSGFPSIPCGDFIYIWTVSFPSKVPVLVTFTTIQILSRVISLILLSKANEVYDNPYPNGYITFSFAKLSK